MALHPYEFKLKLPLSVVREVHELGFEISFL
jgi:hypothetical protein